MPTTLWGERMAASSLLSFWIGAQVTKASTKLGWPARPRPAPVAREAPPSTLC